MNLKKILFVSIIMMNAALFADLRKMLDEPTSDNEQARMGHIMAQEIRKIYNNIELTINKALSNVAELKQRKDEWTNQANQLKQEMQQLEGAARKAAERDDIAVFNLSRAQYRSKGKELIDNAVLQGMASVATAPQQQ